MEVMSSLIIFTLFVCVSAGTFAIQGVYVASGKGAKVQFPALVVSLVALVIGGIGSFTHLQHWDRAFNGFGHITSGITQELIGVVLMVIAMIIFFAVTRKKDEAPKWVGILAVVISVVMLILMTTSYMMPARPIWNTFALYIFYFAEAIVAGGAIIWIISALTGAEDVQALSAKITAVGGALVFVAILVYLAVIGTAGFAEVGNYYDPTHPTKTMLDAGGLLGQVAGGSFAIYFWGALLLGGCLPAIAGFIKRKDGASGLSFGVIAIIGALLGGILFRVLLYLLGYSAFLYF